MELWPFIAIKFVHGPGLEGANMAFECRGSLTCATNAFQLEVLLP